MARHIGTNTYTIAENTVSSNPILGKFTTLNEAYAATSPGDILYLLDDIFEENLVFDNGSRKFIGLSRSQGACTIKGLLDDNGNSLTNSYQNITFLNDGDFSIVNTGSGSGSVLFNCILTAIDHNSINVAAGATITIQGGLGNLTASGLKYWEGDGAVLTYGAKFSNSGMSTAISSVGGTQNHYGSIFTAPIGCSGNGAIVARGTTIDVSTLNVCPITLTGTDNSLLDDCVFRGGSAPALIIDTGATATASNLTLDSANTNAIDGAGTLKAGPLTFTGTSSKINATIKQFNEFGDRGTYVPTLTGLSAAGVTTYTFQKGGYTRIGNLVFVWGTVQISAATGTGAMLISLPFECSAEGFMYGSCTMDSAAWAMPVGRTSMSFQALPNQAAGVFITTGTSVSEQALQMQNAAGMFYYSITYQVD